MDVFSDDDVERILVIVDPTYFGTLVSVTSELEGQYGGA